MAPRPGPGRDAELEPVRVALEQGDRRRLGVEQRDRGVDDRLEQRLLGVRVEAAGNRRPPRCLAECLQRGGQCRDRSSRTGSERFSGSALVALDGPSSSSPVAPSRACGHPVALDVVVVAGCAGARRCLRWPCASCSWPSTSSSRRLPESALVALDIVVVAGGRWRSWLWPSTSSSSPVARRSASVALDVVVVARPTAAPMARGPRRRRRRRAEAGRRACGARRRSSSPG